VFGRADGSPKQTTAVLDRSAELSQPPCRRLHRAHKKQRPDSLCEGFTVVLRKQPLYKLHKCYPPSTGTRHQLLCTLD